MGMLELALHFQRIVDAAGTATELAEALAAIASKIGFQYFALTHHVDMVAAGGDAIRIHNYPQRWADFYDRHALGLTDPVHRASHLTSFGFCWSRIPRMIPLTSTDLRILRLGAEQGIGDGFTVPSHVPGEARGSCSFANEVGRRLPVEMLPLAQFAGGLAFENARRIWSGRGYRRGPAEPLLTDRQRDCVLWAAREKTDWEIGGILSISEETVTRHLKNARERYGVAKRTLLAIRTLYDGTLTFTDIFKR